MRVMSSLPDTHHRRVSNATDGRLEVLLLDYEMARDDDRSTVAVQGTVLSVAVALLVGMAAVISQACTYQITTGDCARVPDALLAAVPLAPLAMVCYLQMVGTAGTVRNFYLRALEHELRSHVPAEFTAVRGVKPATYIELLTGHISTRRGSTSYRFIGFFIVSALLVLFGGLTVFMATGVSAGWAVAMIVVYGTAASFIAVEAVSATMRGRRLFRKLASRVSDVPDLPSPTDVPDPRKQRSLLSCLIVPRARFDEAVKRIFIPLAFLLAVAARGNWGSVDFLQATLVWIAFEFLLYDARYQWNDIRNFVEDGRNGRRDRLPHSTCTDSDVARRQDLTTIHAAIAAVIGRLLLAVVVLVLFTSGGPDGNGWLTAAALAAAVLITAIVYEVLRTQHRVWPVWIWVGAGYGVRGVIGVALAGYAIASWETALTFVALAAFGVMSVTLTWTLQTMGRCSGSGRRDGPRRDAAAPHPPACVRRRNHQLTGVRTSRGTARSHMDDRTHRRPPIAAKLVARTMGTDADRRLCSRCRTWDTAVRRQPQHSGVAGGCHDRRRRFRRPPGKGPDALDRGVAHRGAHSRDCLRRGFARAV